MDTGGMSTTECNCDAGTPRQLAASVCSAVRRSERPYPRRLAVSAASCLNPNFPHSLPLSLAVGVLPVTFPLSVWGIVACVFPPRPPSLLSSHRALRVGVGLGAAQEVRRVVLGLHARRDVVPVSHPLGVVKAVSRGFSFVRVGARAGSEARARAGKTSKGGDGGGYRSRGFGAECMASTRGRCCCVGSLVSAGEPVCWL